ncbi:MAG: ParB N-terminal domain-containing protein [Magnetococcales bacterium]|nr:ParB N-terminal domain-containing protein [Magnetococcales bacterium]
MNVQEIPTENIIEIDRLREVDADVVEGLAFSIRVNGLQQPIQVRKQPLTEDKFILISGAHRLMACKALGMESVSCVVVECSGLEARLMEVDENLIRYELTPFDRGAFLAERKKIHEEMFPQTKAGVAGAIAKHHGDENNEITDGSASDIMSFAKATAEKLNINPRTIQRSIRMERNLSPESKAAIPGTWLARSGKDLEMLSRQTPEIQEKVLNLIHSVPDMAKPGGVAMALDRLLGRPKETVKPELRAHLEFEAFLKLWEKTGAMGRSYIIGYFRGTERICDKVFDKVL